MKAGESDAPGVSETDVSLCVSVQPEEELDPEERDHFLQQLYKFMEDRGETVPLTPPPVTEAAAAGVSGLGWFH